MVPFQMKKAQKEKRNVGGGTQIFELFEQGCNFYEILGVTKDADQSQLKKAYYKLALKNHPDKVQGSEAEKENANKNFQALGRIYETLSNEDKRKFYDETGEHDTDELLDRDKNWEEYWRLLFKKITVEDIESYEVHPPSDASTLSILSEKC